jgi:hypothetical protein
MSQIIINEHDEQNQVATNLGWSEFCEWAETLDLNKYFEVQHLVLHGWERDLTELADELEQAIEENPLSDNVSRTAKAIIDFIHKHKSEIVMITNGVEADVRRRRAKRKSGDDESLRRS